ncbi:MAG: DNA primase, partial [Acidobacteriota bacterium]
MATIPADFIEQVRQSTDIVGVVSKYVPLKRAGASFKALCPFHKEKTPSFNVSPDRQIFHCFGCGQGGDAFKFLMLYEKMSFTEAVSHLADSAGLAMPTTGRQGRGQTRDDRSLLLRLHEEAARFFQSQLTKHPGGRRALAYLRERGLTTKTVEDMGFGYAPDSWTALLEHLTRRGAKPEQLAHAGLVVPRREGGGYYDRFRSRIIIPIRSESGKVVAFGGRILGPGEPKYLNSPESAIYAKSRTLYGLHRAKDPIRSAGYAILMEGYLDCIQAYQVGIGNAVACCGTSLTSGHASLLRRYTDRAVVNFDPDQAGEAATRRSIDLLIEEGFEVKVLHLPGGEDPDSFIRNRGADAYREGLADATPFVDYLMCTAAARYDVGSPRGKAEFLNEVLPTL